MHLLMDERLMTLTAWDVNVNGAGADERSCHPSLADSLLSSDHRHIVI